MEIQYNEGYFFGEITKEDFEERKERFEDIDEDCCHCEKKSCCFDTNVEKLLADGNTAKTLLLIAIGEDLDDSDSLFVQNFDKILVYSSGYGYLTDDTETLLKVIDKKGKERYFILDNEPIEIYFGSYDEDDIEAAYYEQAELLDCRPKDFMKCIDRFVSQLPEPPDLIGICVTM
ncbi:hypothetical protein H0A61_02899 [Koleobacter methoxysyntrophicus]|jgi:hypothetical protein|uniref:Uncharacterized protein n=1 Tax=Koleobacter methoxysyntrophicus TaxID=2751313 RepID=A0A8A0RQ39_9FIRM|nr:hypothetical protein [Koleobacter methoxysyntrophicus]QSQ10491.1 hypothetical protein H0A61_02899 [Koleobacter methoxysyntrophicus]